MKLTLYTWEEYLLTDTWMNTKLDIARISLWRAEHRLSRLLNGGAINFQSMGDLSCWAERISSQKGKKMRNPPTGLLLYQVTIHSISSIATVILQLATHLP